MSRENLLRVKELKTLLGVSTVVPFRSELHRLELPGELTLYPKGYVESLAVWLRAHRRRGRRALNDYARDFALTGAAAAHIVLTENRFESEIYDNSREVEGLNELAISTAGIAQVLGVTRSIVQKWTKRDRLLRPVERRGQNLFTLSNFAQIYRWRHPEALPGDNQQANYPG